MATPDDLHEWISFDDPDEQRTWVFDATYLRSNHRCIYGEGCQGVLDAPAEHMQPLLRSYDGSPILMGIRAENMETLSRPANDALQVEVLVVEPLGSQNLLTVKIGEDLVKVSTHPTFRVEPGQDVWLKFPSEKIRWVDRDNGKVLYPAQ